MGKHAHRCGETDEIDKQTETETERRQKNTGSH